VYIVHDGIRLECLVFASDLAQQKGVCDQIQLCASLVNYKKSISHFSFWYRSQNHKIVQSIYIVNEHKNTHERNTTENAV
jgi:hypothetical protein